MKIKSIDLGIENDITKELMKYEKIFNNKFVHTPCCIKSTGE